MLNVTITDIPDANAYALENQFGLADRVTDEAALQRSVQRFRERGITLPTFAQVANPSSFSHADKVGDADHNAADPRNLWRVPGNDLWASVAGPQIMWVALVDRGGQSIIVVFGDRFPVITAHKVLAAYSCLAPRIVTGQFDPTHHPQVISGPLTGNATPGRRTSSRIMASRGVASCPKG